MGQYRIGIGQTVRSRGGLRPVILSFRLLAEPAPLGLLANSSATCLPCLPRKGLPSINRSFARATYLAVKTQAVPWTLAK